MAATTPTKKMIIQIGVPLSGKTTDANIGVEKMAERGEKAVVLSLDDMPGVYVTRPLVVVSGGNAPNSMVGQVIEVVREANSYLVARSNEVDILTTTDVEAVALQFAQTNFPLRQLPEKVRVAFHRAFASFFVDEICGCVPSSEEEVSPEPETMQAFQLDSSAIKAFLGKVNEAIADDEIDTIIISNCNTKLDAFRSYVYNAYKKKIQVEFRNYAIPSYDELFKRNFTRFWRTGKWIPLDIINSNIKQYLALQKSFPDGLTTHDVILDRASTNNNVRTKKYSGVRGRRRR